MSKIVINGGRRLLGEVCINGSKNAVSAIISAALLCENGASVIENLPVIEDVDCFRDILTRLGVNVEMPDRHTMKIDANDMKNINVDFESVGRIRASYYTMGALLGRFGNARVKLPGGCDFGSRPIDLHLKGFKALGARIEEENGIQILTAENGLKGAHIFLDKPSVGATINIMLAAVRAEGQTVIEGAAKEPHVVDTASFLNMIGANVKGAGTNIIRINGTQEFCGAQYTIIPDQIEAGTYMIAAAATGGDVTITNVIPKHMDSLSAKLKEMNCLIEENGQTIRVAASGPLKAVDINAMYYPGLPTDLQPQITALMSISSGTSLITESVFDDRFRYVKELAKLGAKLTLFGNKAVQVEGPVTLCGADVTATDLRAGAALIIGGLAASGTTSITNIRHIDRGYEDVVGKLKQLGADIERL